jgi:hypothetical protein
VLGASSIVTGGVTMNLVIANLLYARILSVAMNPPPEELARHSCAHTLWRELRFCKRKRLQLEAIAAASSHGVLATVFGHLLKAIGDHNKAALLAMTRF